MTSPLVPTTPAQVLRATADLFELNPEFWTTGWYSDPITGCRCVMGGISWAVNPFHTRGNPHLLIDPEDRALAFAAIDVLTSYLVDELGFWPEDGETGPLVGIWNDKSTLHEVVGTCRSAAAWDEARSAVAS